MSVGLRILQRRQEVSPDLVAAFRTVPVSCVSDSMARLYAAGPRLRPMHRGGVLAGPAVTVRTRPGDNLMVHAALDWAEPGDVIVVDAGGDLTNAMVGELMSAYAAERGLAGLVIDGAIRDSAAIRDAALPVYAAGITHRGPYRDGPGEINVPLALGTMPVRPGDLILGDDDGLVCVPLDDAETVLKAAQAKAAAEARQMEQIRSGTQDRSWIGETLKRLGCEVETPVSEPSSL